MVCRSPCVKGLILRLDDKPLLTRGLAQKMVNEMKQDYLWDKSGDDAEIKGLEDILSTFRYQETAGPLVHVAEPVTAVRPEPRWRFSFIFAFAGSVAVAVILIGIWLQFPNGQRQTVGDVATTSRPQVVPQTAEPERYSNTSEMKVNNVDNTTVTALPTKAILRQQVKKRALRNLMAKKVSPRKDPLEALTADERYAYGQLMLALSITSSKLKMVSDKVNGTED